MQLALFFLCKQLVLRKGNLHQHLKIFGAPNIFKCLCRCKSTNASPCSLVTFKT